MFKLFRALIEAVMRLKVSVDALTAAQREAGPAEDRLEALELRQAMWEAEVEGLLMKAEGKLSASNNAENRTRTMKRTYEKFIDPLDPDFEEESTPVRADHAPPSQEEGVQRVRVDVAADYKTLALSRKFG